MTDEEAPTREPMFNAPWPALLIPGSLVAAYFWLATQRPDLAMSWALSADAVRAGQYQTLLTYIWVHAGWAHLAMNSLAAFAFGPPVVRLFGEGPKAAVGFLSFFVVCAVLSGAGFVVVHWGDGAAAVGASGAVSGLWGAASRILAGRGLLAPLSNRAVLIQALVFGLLNLATGLFDVMFGVQVAWEAHVFGYTAGLILIGPFATLFASRR